jgi:type VI secretion system secreted protein VgrG
VQAGQVVHRLRLAGNERLELYDYPGGYAERFDGVGPGGGDQPDELQNIFRAASQDAGIRIQVEAEQSVVVTGSSTVAAFTSGRTFALQGHFNADGSYLLTDVTHAASQDAGASQYTNSFTCIPDGVPFRPVRSTPKPVLGGSQTAIVVGPAGEEVFTDKYGRVKVQFHWDREGKNDENSSCWVRVAQAWAGATWGAIHIPRIGQEVIVDFLEGDPDRPIITGRVYNADNMPPYTLPDNKTQSGIKSRSTLSGAPSNFNELRFEDKKGSELVNVQAEKDLNSLVKHDEDRTVGNDRTTGIGHDELVTVGNNRTEMVAKQEQITIGGDRQESVAKSETVSVGTTRALTVGTDETIQVGGKRADSVAKDESITVGGAQSLSVGKSQSVDVGKDQTVNVGGGVTLSVTKDESVTVGGNLTVSVSKGETRDIGKKLALSAGDQITVTAGSSSITLKSNGDITIKAGGKITIQGSSDVVVKGSKVSLN